MLDSAQAEIVGDWKHFQEPAETKKTGAALYRNKWQVPTKPSLGVGE